MWLPLGITLVRLRYGCPWCASIYGCPWCTTLVRLHYGCPRVTPRVGVCPRVDAHLREADDLHVAAAPAALAHKALAGGVQRHERHARARLAQHALEAREALALGVDVGLQGHRPPRRRGAGRGRALSSWGRDPLPRSTLRTRSARRLAQWCRITTSGLGGLGLGRPKNPAS